MTQKRLQRLTEMKRIQRGRDSLDLPYYYFLGRKPGQIEHRLGVNWVRLWVAKRFIWDGNMKVWEYEPDYGPIRPDGLAVMHNAVANKSTLYLVEYEQNHHAFTKVEQYNTWYAQRGYLKTWWGKVATGFPAILIVTDTPTRAKAIQKAIERDNANGLEFRVVLTNKIKEELK